MIERTLFLFVFILILLVICFTALICIIEDTSNDTKSDKRLYKENEGVKKDL